jgi:protein TonB
MSHALALPTDRVDPKRVAGTAATIAVHVAAILLLLMPPALTPVAEIEPPPVVVDWEKPRLPPPPPPPPPPTIRNVRPDTPPQPTITQRVEQPEMPPVIFTDTSANAFVAPPVITEPPVIGEPPSGPMDLEVVSGPSPIYPSRAIAMGISGRVVLRIEVDATGKPVSGTIESSSGSRLLDDAALKTVLRRWRFRPAEWNGQPVAATARVPVDFVLE